MRIHKLSLTILIYIFLGVVTDMSWTEEDNIFMSGSARLFLHADVNSYFGYSISTYVGQNKAFCLVGAPRDVGDEDFQENTGSVFRISIESDDCARVPMSSVDFGDQTHSNVVPGYSKWLGGSVSTSVNGVDGVQLGCDPRFLSKTSHGINKTEQQLLGIGQCSLYTGASLDSIIIQPCSSIDEGACLSGFSSSLLVEENGIIKVALGLPGSFLTEGNVFLGSYKGKELIDKVKLKTSPMDLKNRGYNLGYVVQVAKLWRKPLEPSPFINVLSNDVVVTSSTLWKNNDYKGVVLVLDSKLDLSQIVYVNDMNGHLGSNFGASLTTGDFNGDGILDIAVGSPYFTDHWTSSKRSVDIGSVNIFYGLVSSNQKYTVSEDKDVLKGPKERGNFGMSLATLGDIDGDHRDDFAVGCPSCGDDSTGSVYIYLGGFINPVQIIRPRHLMQVPVVPLCSNSEDRAIMRPFQKFGWSLSGQFDLDHNLVPDLIVGDYASAQVAYLQSRNLIWLQNSQWLLPPFSALNWTDSTRSDLPCLGDLCRYFISLKSDIFDRQILGRKSITFEVEVDLDSEIKIEREKRIQFVSSGRSVRRQSLDFVFQDSIDTVELFAAVIEPRFECVRARIWQPLVINVTIIHTLTKSSPWMFHPFRGLRYFESPGKMFKNPNCGADDECVSDVRVFVTDWSPPNTHKTDIFFEEKIKERNVVIGIGNWGENAFGVKLGIVIPSVLEFQGFGGHNCSMRLSKDTTNVIASCHFGEPFQRTGNNVLKIHLVINTGGAFAAYKKHKNTSKGGLVLTIKVEGTCMNRDLDLSNNVAAVDYFLKMSGTVQVTPNNLETTTIDSRNFSTKVSKFQKVYPETLGPPYKSIFTITNSGPSPLESIDFNIHVPFKTRNGENILYFLRRINQQDSYGNPLSFSQLPEVITIKGVVHGQCHLPNYATDPLNLNVIERNLNYNERKTYSFSKRKEKVSVSSERLNLKFRSEQFISCNDSKSVFGSIECLNIQCTISNLTLQSEVQIIIRARIWAETFFQYRVSESLIHTSVFGDIQPQSYGLTVSGDLKMAPTHTIHTIIFKGIDDLSAGSILMWPIILGVILGLLFLNVIILLLWKYGFFSRHRQFKAAVNADNNNLSNGYSSRYKNSSLTTHL